VEIALESSTLSVSRLDDPRSRGAKLYEVREDLGLESLVLETQSNGGTHLTPQLRDADCVRNHRDPAIVSNERCDRATGLRDRFIHEGTVRAYISAGSGEPIGDPEIRVSHCHGERRLQRSGEWRVAEAGHRASHSPPLQPGPHHRPHERGAEKEHPEAGDEEAPEEGRLQRILERETCHRR